ncbi:MAG: polysaccharide deacetylase family protein [Bacteroidales bacterium]|nr:polysaccharide deacetylase family protein [Bacteroidales bacterium]
MSRIYAIFPLILIFFASPPVKADEIVCLRGGGDTMGIISFFQGGDGFETDTAFVSLAWEIPGIIPGLSVVGDFNGDGRSEIALFMKVPYEPNMNPDYTCSDIMVFRSDVKDLLPAGTWFSVIDTEFDFNCVNHAVAGDFNSDGKDDIAVFYNNPANEEQVIHVFKSDGKGFSYPREYYGTLRSEFNFTCIKYALPGDFNGNGKPDIAVFYDYPGEDPLTAQGIFIFESGDNVFSLLPPFYSTSRQVLDFDCVKDAAAADFDNDGCSDIALFYSNPAATDHQLLLFRGEALSFSGPDTWYTGNNASVDPAGVQYIAAGHFNEDVLPDLTVFYNNSGSGSGEILLYPGSEDSFLDQQTVWSGPGSCFDDISAVMTGLFHQDEMIRATTWKDNHKGAISFTFDDGAYGAFAHGAECLEQAGLKGTFYIFTDTILVYDFPLAGTSLIKYYRDRGFEIASHTMNHSNLGLLTGEGEIDSVRTLIQHSKEELDERFEQNTLTLSIPFGSFQYETLRLIAETFLTARSSEYGYNLATPANFLTLKSFPVLSTTSPATVLERVAIAEQFGYYLPLMYHDIEDEYFDPGTHIYTYSLEYLRETIDSVMKRDVWVDTHENVYKYIMQRNGLEVTMNNSSDELFAFTLDDGLPDSVFNVELTLQLMVPEDWNEAYVTIDDRGELTTLEVISSGDERYVFFNCLPGGSEITVYKGVYTGIEDDAVDISESTQIKVFPNPVSGGSLKLEADLPAGGKVNLLIYDTRGNCIRNIYLGRMPAGRLDYFLDTGNLAPGIYILHVSTSGGDLKPVLFMKV